MILETTARRGTPVVIRVVDPVPVELRPIAVVQIDIRHLVGGLVAGAGLLPISIHATEDRALPPKGLYALSPELYAAAGRVGTVSHPH
ncbi:MAG: hypothetical protein HYS57_01270 [Parcubacteria group bacterium]|nr:hypothetical protein [Parcubacteria group bacterium]